MLYFKPSSKLLFILVHPDLIYLPVSFFQILYVIYLITPNLFSKCNTRFKFEHLPRIIV
jgi:hypothetical protein